MTMMLSAWSSLTTLAAPAVRVALYRRVRRGKEIAERLPERWGIDSTPRPGGRLIWLHASSVGESVSVLPVLAAMARAAPDAAMLITTGTVTSAAVLDRRLPDLGLSERVMHRFAPLDVPRWVRRFIDHWRPDAVALVESELWPNLLVNCRRRGIPMVLLNARMSDRSYRRWRRAAGLARTLLGSFVAVQAQSASDAARLGHFGVAVTTAPGNLKFAAPALPVDDTELARLRTVFRDWPCWVAASTHRGEEVMVLAAHRLLALNYPDIVTIIVPRHPERSDEIVALAADMPLARRSRAERPQPGGVWLADTLGELGLWYRLAGVALMGRSLVPPGGGQNPLEPARLGCAVASGPFMANFREPAHVLEQAGAMATLADAAAIARWVGTMLADPGLRRTVGERAAGAVIGNDELAQRAADLVLDLLPPAAA